MKSVKRYDGKIEHCDNGGYVTFADYKKLEARLENATGREMKLKALIAEQQAVIDQRNGECDRLINELAALRERAVSCIPPAPYLSHVEEETLSEYEMGEAQGRCSMWEEYRSNILQLNSGSKNDD